MLATTDLYTVSRFLGHSSVTTMQIFVQSTEDKVIYAKRNAFPLNEHVVYTLI